MKIKASALAQQLFKTLVSVVFPTDQLNDKGETVYATAKFVGHFRAVPVSDAQADMDKLKALRDAGDHVGMIGVEAKRVEQCFVGFEPVPGQEFPITDDNDQPLTNTPDNIKLLLNSREVRDAVRKAFETARSSDVLEKNLQK
ncbi:hypothetical protein [Rheinheimera baltica]|uniref:hypothetical protein n=1 Tax=Rheinheimera baltica TaxID=67576 RepID=UPI00041702A7|nr:hypothetical protein [Rheinheimera baltica]